MFNNIGSKIKGLALFTFVVGLIFSVIIGIICISLDGGLIGFLVIIFGGVLSYIGNLAMYGFGELIENTGNIMDELGNVNTSLNRIVNRISFPLDNSNVNRDKNKKAISDEIKKDEKDTSVHETKKALIPVCVIETDNNQIMCPVCNTIQSPNRSRCFECGQMFINE